MATTPVDARRIVRRVSAALLAMSFATATLPSLAQEASPPAATGVAEPATPSVEAPALTPTVPDSPPASASPQPQADAPADAAAAPTDAAAAADPAAPADPAGSMSTDAEAAPAIDPPAPQAAAGATKSGALPHDLSPWGMYQAADIVVKAVMIGLVIASFMTWTIWAAKAFELWASKRRLKRAIRQIGAASDLDAALAAFGRSRSTGATLVRVASEEMLRSAAALDHVGPDGIKERVTSRLSRVEANAGRRMTLGTGVLATIGSTAPFVGLFGTVWGIMNSFIGISQSQTTNLAVVAPGIAEALLATAIGLVAAIPAVIIYNMFARSIAGYRLMLADASAKVEQLVSWELDLRRLPQGAMAEAAE